LRPTTHLNQPNGFGFEFLPEPSLRLAHEMLLFPSEELSAFPGQVQATPKSCCGWSNRKADIQAVPWMVSVGALLAPSMPTVSGETLYCTD
jgi:hypothetical protein